MRTLAFISLGFLIGFILLAWSGRNAARRSCKEKGHVWDPVLVGEMEYLYCARCGVRGR